MAPSVLKAEPLYVSDGIDWPAVCAIAYRARIAPVVYQCLRSTAIAVPGDVVDWFRVQHYDTIARNLASLNTLRSVLDLLARAGVASIVFKGPALAALGHEMARSWKDLDILVSGAAMGQVESVLLEAGYQLLHDLPHPNHRRYALGGDLRHSVLEVHFNISDRLRSYCPDVADIWARAIDANVLGVSARVPELADHLLLTIMQLPHHHWSVRLLLDIWQLITKRHEALVWSELFARARAWRMLALTRSTLSVLTTAFGVPLPEFVLSKIEPVDYYDRLRRQIASRSVDEQFEYPFRPRVMWIAPFVVVERPSHALGILARRLLAGGDFFDEGRIETAVRRNLKSIEVLPAVLRVLAASVLSSPPHEPGGHP